MPRTDYILKLKLMLAIVLAVLCVRSSFAVGYSCFAEVSNANSQVCFATYYDANGNMTRDLNKGISNITYNLLNLPGEITFSDGRKVKYIYTADGKRFARHILMQQAARRCKWTTVATIFSIMAL